MTAASSEKPLPLPPDQLARTIEVEVPGIRVDRPFMGGRAGDSHPERVSKW